MDAVAGSDTRGWDGDTQEARGYQAGDTVQAGAGEWHWHGAGPGTFMTHLAVQEADEDGQTTYWGEHVTDDEYRG